MRKCPDPSPWIKLTHSSELPPGDAPPPPPPSLRLVQQGRRHPNLENDVTGPISIKADKVFWGVRIAAPQRESHCLRHAKVRRNTACLYLGGDNPHVFVLFVFKSCVKLTRPVKFAFCSVVVFSLNVCAGNKHFTVQCDPLSPQQLLCPMLFVIVVMELCLISSLSFLHNPDLTCVPSQPSQAPVCQLAHRAGGDGPVHRPALCGPKQVQSPLEAQLKKGLQRRGQ